MSIKKDKSLILNAIKLHYKFKSNADFASFLGIAPTTLSSWYSRGTFDYELLYAKCVDINGDWLLSGIGSMIRNNNMDYFSNTVEEPPPKFGNQCENCNRKEERIKDLLYIIDIQKELIQQLKERGDADEGVASVAAVG